MWLTCKRTSVMTYPMLFTTTCLFCYRRPLSEAMLSVKIRKRVWSVCSAWSYCVVIVIGLSMMLVSYGYIMLFCIGNSYPLCRESCHSYRSIMLVYSDAYVCIDKWCVVNKSSCSLIIKSCSFCRHSMMICSLIVQSCFDIDKSHHRIIHLCWSVFRFYCVVNSRHCRDKPCHL